MGHARIEVPVGRFADSQVPRVAAEGAVQHTAVRLSGDARTPLQLVAPLREQLEEAGFVTLFECIDRACGGFDFRYAVDLLPEPAMHVDLGDFHWLTASRTRTEGPAEVVTLMVSRSRTSGFVHVTHVDPDPPAATAPAEDSVTLSSRNAPDPLLDDLLNQGRATLEDLSFATGVADLGDHGFSSLESLANWLSDTPGARVSLVGHSDSRGALDRNIALSEARAAAVRDRLISGFGIDPERLSVKGLGPAEPRATNDTEDGRRLNRRVEVVVVD